MRLLVIEDNHKIATTLKNTLMGESFAVDLAYNDEDGLAAAQSEDYDLIILDRMLSGQIDGIEICRTLRANGNHTPILMLTAKDQVSHRIEGLNAGADDYLVKPFSLGEVLARVRALLRRPHEAIGDLLVVGDLSLDAGRRAG